MTRKARSAHTFKILTLLLQMVRTRKEAAPQALTRVGLARRTRGNARTISAFIISHGGSQRARDAAFLTIFDHLYSMTMA